MPIKMLIIFYHEQKHTLKINHIWLSHGIALQIIFSNYQTNMYQFVYT